MKLNWKRPLFYLLLPVLTFMVFVGFMPPFPPPRPTKAAQEQSTPAEEQDRKGGNAAWPGSVRPAA